jgi:hypothetical protein
VGAITAVAVWDHLPAASELLDRRLALGWRPTPTLLRTGERVLGYAACAVTSAPHRPSGPRRMTETRRFDADAAT